MAILQIGPLGSQYEAFKIERTCPRCRKRRYSMYLAGRVINGVREPRVVCAECGHKWKPRIAERD